MGFHRNPLPGLESVRDFEWICRGGRAAQRVAGAQGTYPVECTRNTRYLQGPGQALRPGARWAAPGRRFLPGSRYGAGVLRRIRAARRRRPSGLLVDHDRLGRGQLLDRRADRSRLALDPGRDRVDVAADVGPLTAPVSPSTSAVLSATSRGTAAGCTADRRRKRSGWRPVARDLHRHRDGDEVVESMSGLVTMAGSTAAASGRPAPFTVRRRIRRPSGTTATSGRPERRAAGT